MGAPESTADEAGEVDTVAASEAEGTTPVVAGALGGAELAQAPATAITDAMTAEARTRPDTLFLLAIVGFRARTYRTHSLSLELCAPGSRASRRSASRRGNGLRAVLGRQRANRSATNEPMCSRWIASASSEKGQRIELAREAVGQPGIGPCGREGIGYASWPPKGWLARNSEAASKQGFERCGNPAPDPRLCYLRIAGLSKRKEGSGADTRI